MDLQRKIFEDILKKYNITLYDNNGIEISLKEIIPQIAAQTPFMADIHKDFIAQYLSCRGGK